MEKLIFQKGCNPICYSDKDVRAAEPFTSARKGDELSLAPQDVHPCKILADQECGVDKECVAVVLGSVGKPEYAEPEDVVKAGLKVSRGEQEWILVFPEELLGLTDGPVFLDAVCGPGR